MDYLIMAGQLMLSLSILIVLHEMGHFLPARWFGTRVEKFYLFFDPWFPLFKKKIGETEYGIGWLPLGGYVKISGMIDESFDTEQMKQPAQPWEFRSKTAWQRLIIMLGGVTVNFLLGFFIYGMVLFVWGEEYIPNKNVEYGIYVDSLGNDMGLRDGDHIISIGNQPFDKFEQRAVILEIVLNNADHLMVNRNEQETRIPIDEKFVGLLSGKNTAMLFDARVPFVAAQISEGSPADKAGIKPEDRIIAFDGKPTTFFNDFSSLAKNSPDKDVTITVVRNNKDTLNLSLKTSPEGTIGIYRFGAEYFFETERQEYSLAAALPAGVNKGWNFLTMQLKAFGQMFKGKIKASDSLGGFGSIGKMLGSVWLWERFWTMTAALSIILAFMNLLPIPALDGGHVMFLLYEMVTGRKPSDSFLEKATIVGFIIVIGLVIYANGLDLLRWINSVF